MLLEKAQTFAPIDSHTVTLTAHDVGDVDLSNVAPLSVFERKDRAEGAYTQRDTGNAGLMLKAPAIGACEIKPVKFPDKHRRWIREFNAAWDKRVTQPMARRFRSPALNQRLETLREKIGPEWAKSNEIRCIDTDTLKQWIKWLKRAKELPDALKLVAAIERTVGMILSQTESTPKPPPEDQPRPRPLRREFRSR